MSDTFARHVSEAMERAIKILPLIEAEPTFIGKRIGPRRARGKRYPYNSLRAQQRGARQIAAGVITVSNGLRVA